MSIYLVCKKAFTSSTGIDIKECKFTENHQDILIGQCHKNHYQNFFLNDCIVRFQYHFAGNCCFETFSITIKHKTIKQFGNVDLIQQLVWLEIFALLLLMLKL
ncbi:hypothetical protein ACKWTF_005605 [Chironomus riparius]